MKAGAPEAGWERGFKTRGGVNDNCTRPVNTGECGQAPAGVISQGKGSMSRLTATLFYPRSAAPVSLPK